MYLLLNLLFLKYALCYKNNFEYPQVIAILVILKHIKIYTLNMSFYLLLVALAKYLYLNLIFREIINIIY
jgi:hypothetical protein